jgi:YtxH-like protein
MNSPDPKWLMRQFGYVPARTTQSTVLQAVGLVAVGALCGAAAIALLTPKSGPQLRGDIAAQAQRIRGRVGDRARELKDKVASMKDSGNGVMDVPGEG